MNKKNSSNTQPHRSTGTNSDLKESRLGINVNQVPKQQQDGRDSNTESQTQTRIKPPIRNNPHLVHQSIQSKKENDSNEDDDDYISIHSTKSDNTGIDVNKHFMSIVGIADNNNVDPIVSLGIVQSL